MTLAIRTAILWACLSALAALATIAAARLLLSTARTAARRMCPRISLPILALTAVSILYGGRKGTITVDDPYIINDGSYLTNDVAHVAIAKRTQLLPDSTEILVYARKVDQTNATDWVRLEPHLTFAEHPHDYHLPNATNHDVIASANYVPAPTVHTNGVWQMKGFIIQGTGKAAFPNTRTIKKETP